MYSNSLRAGRSGSNPGWGEVLRTCPDRPWGPPGTLYNGYWVFPGDKAARAWPYPPTSSSVEDEERVELYSYSHNTNTGARARARTGVIHFILTVGSKRALPVIVRSGANMWAVFLPNGDCPSNSTRSHVKCPIVLPNLYIYLTET